LLEAGLEAEQSASHGGAAGGSVSVFLGTIGAVSTLAAAYGVATGQFFVGAAGGVVGLTYLLLVLSGVDEEVSNRFARFQGELKTASGYREVGTLAWSYWVSGRPIDHPATVVERVANWEIYIMPAWATALGVTVMAWPISKIVATPSLAAVVLTLTVAAVCLPVFVSLLCSLAMLGVADEARSQHTEVETNAGQQNG
jgi:hypothetical protein